MKLSWTDGGLYPPRPDVLPDDVILQAEGGVIFVGSKGILINDTYGSNPRVYPLTLAEAAAEKTCCVLHHGGNTTATTSVSGRTCNESAATAIALASNRAVAFSQDGQRDIALGVALSISGYRDIKCKLIER